MDTLIREERYITFIGPTEHVLRVEELVGGTERWPENFRIHVSATHQLQAKTVYGSTAREAVERAVEYIDLGMSATKQLA